MTVFKCKMCGGELEFTEGATVATCAYCGTTQTVPRLGSDRRRHLYDRADHFRRSHDYDKAMAIYEELLNEGADDTADGSADAEAYWSLVLCRFGIDYVEDPRTGRRLPTVNRMQPASVLDDEDYRAALRAADGDQRAIYEAEAREINRIQKEIRRISEGEAPFDVFISCKETDENGQRTPDSVLGQELYEALSGRGYRVFFARVTLEDKLGTAYEPYIFAALQSAKVMVVLGTSPAHFNAVWVRNEWSRFLGLIRDGADKMLIPAYRGMDPYDLPNAFAHLQAQDMGKLGWVQDLTRGIEKIIGKPAAHAEGENTETSGGVEALLKRGYIFLSDGSFTSAGDYFERVLDMDPESSRAYLGKLLAGRRLRSERALEDEGTGFAEDPDFRKAVQYADEETAARWLDLARRVDERVDATYRAEIYRRATALLEAGGSSSLAEAAELFESLGDYRDAPEKARAARDAADEERLDFGYQVACMDLEDGSEISLKRALGNFRAIKGYRDADAKAAECEKRLNEIHGRAAQRQKLKKTVLLSLCGVAVLVAAVWAITWLVTGLRNDFLKIDKTDDGYEVVGVMWEKETYRIPGRVTAIGANAFAHQEKLTEIDLPDGVRAIGKGAFSGCKNLRSVRIPDGVFYIGELAFFRCESLTEIEIPNPAAGIGEGALAECRGLQSLTLPLNDQMTMSTLFRKIIPNDLQHLTITGGRLSSQSLEGCDRVTDLRVADAVTEIEEGALRDCRKVESLTIALDEWTLMDLFHVAVPKTLRFLTLGGTQLSAGALDGAKALTAIRIPAGCKAIGSGALAGAVNLTSIFYDGNAEQWNGIRVEGGNEGAIPAAVYFYSEEQPGKPGQFWHFADEIPTPWPSM